MISRYLSCCLSVLVLLLSSCDGDSRPFTEAAEVQTLGLESITVIAPEGSPEQIVLGTDDRLQLGLTGVVSGGDVVSLSASDRDWFSTDPVVAEVSRDGLVRAKGIGTASFQVDLGGIRSSELGMTVTDALLSTINISRVDTTEGSAEALERCIPQSYLATGEDTDGNVRVLNSVNWTTESETPDAAHVPEENDSNTTQLTALEFVTDLRLIATSGEVTNSLDIPVSNALTDIRVDPPTLTLNAGNTEQLTAFGTYGEAAAEQPDADSPPGVPQAAGGTDITSGVSWSVTSGSESATVDSTGNVSGVRAGTAQIVAACGDLGSSAVAIAVQGTPDSDNLSFEVVDSNVSLGSGNRITLQLGNQESNQVRVKTSTGTSYSADRDVTAEVEWTTDDTLPPIAASLDNTRSDFALITANSNGEIEFTASYRDAEQTLTIVVQ